MWEILEKMSARKAGNLPMSMSFLKSCYNLLAEMFYTDIRFNQTSIVASQSPFQKRYSMERRQIEKNWVPKYFQHNHNFMIFGLFS